MTAEEVTAFRDQVLGLIDDLRSYANSWDWKYGDEWDGERAEIAAVLERRIRALQSGGAGEMSAANAAQPPSEAIPEIERLRAENASLLGSLRRAEAGYAARGKTIDAYEEDIAQLVRENTRLQETATEERLELHRTVNERTAQRDALLESLRTREAHITGTTKEWNALRDAVAAAEQRAEAAEKRLAGLRGYHLCEATIPKPKPHRCNDTSGYYEPDGPLHWLCRRHAAGRAALHDEERSAPPEEGEDA